jgi:hypothetical protein
MGLKKRAKNDDQPPVVRPPFKFLHADTLSGVKVRVSGGGPVPQCTMRAVRIVLASPAFDEDLDFVQRTEESTLFCRVWLKEILTVQYPN